MRLLMSLHLRACYRRREHVHVASYSLSFPFHQLNVVLEFVDGLKSKLADMDEKLDALGSAVGAMHEDVKRLAGRPFLEVYEEWTKRTLEAVGSKLPSEGA